MSAPSWANYLPEHAFEGAGAVQPLAAPSATVEAAASLRPHGQGRGGGPRCDLEPEPPRPWWSGHVWALAQDPRGCREVQAALDMAQEADRVDLVTELRGHVGTASRCPHANYVVQKCITTLGPKHVQFMLDEIITKGPGFVGQVARHKYGCRILQRFFEVMPIDQVQRLGDSLLPSSLVTCSHPYGNYTMQHLVLYGTPAQRARLARALAQRAAEVGSDVYASAVVGKVLGFAEDDTRAALARALFGVPGVLAELLRTRHGAAAARLAVQALPEAEREAAGRQLRDAEQAAAAGVGIDFSGAASTDGIWTGMSDGTERPGFQPRAGSGHQ